jgi:hypothetical protein
MSRPFRAGLWAALIVAFCTVGPPPAPAQPKGNEARREFMRRKLEFSQRVLEGLTLEDYPLISRNAQALRRLSEASEWEVPTIPNATDYVAFTGEFQKLCEELDAKAKDKNIDGATLAYLRLTMSCVNCHKYVRFAVPKR